MSTHSHEYCFVRTLKLGATHLPRLQKRVYRYLPHLTIAAVFTDSVAKRLNARTVEQAAKSQA